MPSKQSTALLAGLTVAVLTLTGCPDAAEQPPAEQPPAPAPAPSPEPTTAAPPATELPEGVTPEMVQQGQQLFAGQGNCYTCHGMDASGTPLAPALNDQEWINVDGTYEQIVGVIQNGVAQPVQYPAPMPAMGGAQLSEDQVRALAAYVYSISRGG